jgi:hypothetical protein
MFLVENLGQRTWLDALTEGPDGRPDRLPWFRAARLAPTRAGRALTRGYVMSQPLHTAPAFGVVSLVA